MESVLRKEEKYLINLVDCRRYEDTLEKLMLQDKHSEGGRYTVRSLYFDSLNDRDFVEKQQGLSVRKKIRLRIYDPNSLYASLEMKQKQGEQQMKRFLRIAREDAILMTQGIYTPLLKYDHPFARECYSLMNIEFYRPKTIVEYKRKAFVAKENRIRITLDSDIRATEGCMDLFAEHLSLYPVLDQAHIVMEIKYNGFLLNYIKDLVKDVNRSSLSVSKYCLGRSISFN
ncbi:MAG: polyphosphate polymerase domain-containing protein [Niameybacter sp.]|uniref:polyphosphate polymerase domain-containing protein n=1 Tax=Niameybacter sp. TaxID=2033640 RepID=UPI002FC59E6C